jgi:hypothetical protein
MVAVAVQEGLDLRVDALPIEAELDHGLVDQLPGGQPPRPRVVQEGADLAFVLMEPVHERVREHVLQAAEGRDVDGAGLGLGLAAARLVAALDRERLARAIIGIARADRAEDRLAGGHERPDERDARGNRGTDARRVIGGDALGMVEQRVRAAKSGSPAEEFGVARRGHLPECGNRLEIPNRSESETRMSSSSGASPEVGP